MANVGDRVQIVDGGIDVTNGNKAKAGKYYGEGGPLWCTVVLIDPNWNTGGRWGLPNIVTKVRCQADNGVVVWQVQPQHVTGGIQASQPETVQTTPSTPAAPSYPSIPNSTVSSFESSVDKVYGPLEKYASNNPYAIGNKHDHWSQGYVTKAQTTGTLPGTAGVETQTGSGNAFEHIPDGTFQDEGGTWRNLKQSELKSIGSRNVQIDQGVLNGKKFDTAWQDQSKRRQMLNLDYENIMNPSSYPYPADKERLVSTDNGGSMGLLAAKYDYQIIPGDPRYKKMITLEDKLKEARASLGLHVHGSKSIAKAVKYYMYNRFKVPDTNMSHSKTVTHIFFTRPDLNLLVPVTINGGTSYQANNQVMNHTEAAMIWRRYPELFKLLTDRKRCGDSDNFNFLLSQQLASFDIEDESISTLEVGKSWDKHSMFYGHGYNGRTGGEFTCNFTEVEDLSVIQLMRLWITYIDNVSKGAWKPSYNLRGSGVDLSDINASHVYTKTLDYAGAVYVFKCGPDGEDVLHWTKYYGVFPISTGENALGWDINKSIGDTPNLSIKFAYCFKRSNSPISLIEFNHNANIASQDDAIYENSFNVNYAHSSRPFVGPPFIELDLGDPILRAGGVNYINKKTQIRLKFRKTSDPALTDDLLYRATLSNRELSSYNTQQDGSTSTGGTNSSGGSSGGGGGSRVVSYNKFN